MKRNVFGINEMQLLRSNEISPIKIISHQNNNEISIQSKNTLFEVLDENTDDKENKEAMPIVTDSLSTGTGSQPKLSKSVKTKDVKSRYAEGKGAAKKASTTSKCTIIPLNRSTPQKDNIQKKMDISFCRYLQSLYVNSLSIAAVNKQKTQFLGQFDTCNKKLIHLSNEINNLNSSISILMLIKDLHKLMNKRSDMIDSTLKSINESELQVVKEQIEHHLQLIEIDEGLDLGEVTQAYVTMIDDFVKKELEEDGVNIGEKFGNIDDMLGEANKVVKEQTLESESFQAKCIDYIDNLLKNIKK